MEVQTITPQYTDLRYYKLEPATISMPTERIQQVYDYAPFDRAELRTLDSVTGKKRIITDQVRK